MSRNNNNPYHQQAPQTSWDTMGGESVHPPMHPQQGYGQQPPYPQQQDPRALPEGFNPNYPQQPPYGYQQQQQNNPPPQPRPNSYNPNQEYSGVQKNEFGNRKIVSFHIDAFSEDDNVHYRGHFKVKKPSILVKQVISTAQVQLCGGMHYSPDEGGGVGVDYTTWLNAEMMAFLHHVIIESPDWWDEGEMGGGIGDENIMYSIFEEALKVDPFRERKYRELFEAKREVEQKLIELQREAEAAVEAGSKDSERGAPQAPRNSGPDGTAGYPQPDASHPGDKLAAMVHEDVS